FGNFSLCAKPDLQTRVKQGDTNASVINKGESVTDVATLSGDSGPVTGSVKFWVCRDADANPDCSAAGSGTNLGTKPISGGIATSDEFTPTQLGFYCCRADYIPADGAKYFATSHTNLTTECFQVIPAEIDLTKVADAASGPAASRIGVPRTH